jgi:outer membrane protein assembly factor BamB
MARVAGAVLVAAVALGSGAAAGAGAPAPLRSFVTVSLPGEPAIPALEGASIWVSIPAEGVLLRLDARSGRRLARIELTRIDRHAFGGGPLVAREGIVWVAAPVHVDDDPGLPRNNSGWIARLDAGTGRLRVTYVTDDPPSAVAAGPAGVWVSGGHTLRQVDPRTGRVVASVMLQRRISDIAVGTGAIWVAAPQSGTLLRIDPRTRRVVREVHVGRMSLSGSLALGSLLWAATDRDVVGVDPRTGRVVQRVALPGALSIAVDGSDVWVYGPTGLYSVASAGTVTRRFAAAAPAFGSVVARRGTIWLSDGVTQTLRRVRR